MDAPPPLSIRWAFVPKSTHENEDGEPDNQSPAPVLLLSGRLHADTCRSSPGIPISRRETRPYATRPPATDCSRPRHSSPLIQAPHPSRLQHQQATMTGEGNPNPPGQATDSPRPTDAGSTTSGLDGFDPQQLIDRSRHPRPGDAVYSPNAVPSNALNPRSCVTCRTRKVSEPFSLSSVFVPLRLRLTGPGPLRQTHALLQLPPHPNPVHLPAARPCPSPASAKRPQRSVQAASERARGRTDQTFAEVGRCRPRAQQPT